MGIECETDCSEQILLYNYAVKSIGARYLFQVIYPHAPIYIRDRYASKHSLSLVRSWADVVQQLI